jgi:hypothetical protein
MKKYKYTWTYSLDRYYNSPKYTFEYIGYNGVEGLYQLEELTKGKAWLYDNTKIEEVLE